MKRGQNLTTILGWAVFLISLIVYTFTLEPTTSYWDCSEFILSAAKLEINHPSGAPFFMVLGRMFSLLSFGNPQKIAATINFMSASASALSVMFLFWIIIMISQKLSDNKILILTSALIGSLTFAFTDSFWFSAVEGEVYALSVFFLTISIWAALKWERQSGSSDNLKWIFFIFLMAGIGIGVHLLNLLAFPAIALIFGFKKFGYSTKVLCISIFIGSVTIFFMISGITPIVLNFLAFTDRIFVNDFHLKPNSGALAGVLFMIIALATIIYFSRKKGKRIIEAAVLCVFFFLAGFSIYSVNVIRSTSNPPVNFGRPDNVYSLINYLNREQYPRRPLFSGQNYNSPVVEIEERYSWDLIQGEYQKIELSPDVKYEKNTCTFFPRMYSNQEGHPDAYLQWIDINGEKVRTENGVIEVPTFTNQLKFFFKYQLGYMYLRYFMWNFSGRQNDIQGRGDLLHGNWITGIPVFDELRIGDQVNMPDWLKNNKARNRYFLIPFMLGITGAFFHFRKHRGSFFAVLVLYLMAGAGLVLYLNEVPITPRERDYVYVGSFMAFCVWIGISVFFIADWLSKIIPVKKISMKLAIFFVAISPFLLLTQNYDDHDRSGRYTARDLSANILKSCPQNTILFTVGDNDTYPLLYCQEVENIRRDVRIVIMPFLSANWFVNQLKNKKYEDEGLAMILPQSKIDLGKLDYVPVIDRLGREISWADALAVVKNDIHSSKVSLSNGEIADFLPSDKLYFNIQDKEEDIRIPVSLSDKTILYKHELVFWDIISSNATNRPICFTSHTIPESYGLLNYAKSESMVYRLTGNPNPNTNLTTVVNNDPKKSYKQLMSEFSWGNVEGENVFLGWNDIVNIRAFQIRNYFNQLAMTLIRQGESEKAVEVIKECISLFPGDKIPFDVFSLEHLHILQIAGENETSEKIRNELKKYYNSNLDYFSTFNDSQQKQLSEQIMQNLYYLNRLVELSRNTEMYDSLQEEFEKYLVVFQGKY